MREVLAICLKNDAKTSSNLLQGKEILHVNLRTRLLNIKKKDKVLPIRDLFPPTIN